jgi:hypothetical protein
MDYFEEFKKEHAGEKEFVATVSEFAASLKPFFAEHPEKDSLFLKNCWSPSGFSVSRSNGSMMPA